MEVSKLVKNMLTSAEQAILDNCQYNCVDGKVFNPAFGRFEDCPNCADVYKKLIDGKVGYEDGKNLMNRLFIPDVYKNKDFDLGTFFPESVISTTSAESRSKILETMDYINKKSILGENLDEDYLFYLGMETDKYPFVFSVLKNYLKAGKKVSPYLDTADLTVLYKYTQDYYKDSRECVFLSEELDTTFEELCKDEVTIVFIPTCAMEIGIHVLQEFIRKRRGRGLRTIVISETLDHSRQIGYVLNQYGFVNRFLESKKKKTVIKQKTVVGSTVNKVTNKESTIEDLNNPSSSIFDKL